MKKPIELSEDQIEGLVQMYEDCGGLHGVVAKKLKMHRDTWSEFRRKGGQYYRPEIAELARLGHSFGMANDEELIHNVIVGKVEISKIQADLLKWKVTTHQEEWREPKDDSEDAIVKAAKIIEKVIKSSLPEQDEE